MSVPKRKELSGAENSKRYQERIEQGVQIAANMKNWPQGVCKLTNFVTTPVISKYDQDLNESEFAQQQTVFKDAFPNITSENCEQSFNKLKQFNNYLISEASILAILAIETEAAYKINYDETIDLFVEQNARKIKF